MTHITPLALLGFIKFLSLVFIGMAFPFMVYFTCKFIKEAILFVYEYNYKCQGFKTERVNGRLKVYKGHRAK